MSAAGPHPPDVSRLGPREAAGVGGGGGGGCAGGGGRVFPQPGPHRKPTTCHGQCQTKPVAVTSLHQLGWWPKCTPDVHVLRALSGP